jgi:hypothetical protein
MKSPLCDATLKHVIQYVILATFCLLSDFSSVQGKYRNWAKTAGFESKLPGDIKKRKAATEETMRTLDSDLVKKKPCERVVPYSDKLFRRVAVEWLVATDQVSVYSYIFKSLISSSSQPIRALEHPKFHELINAASRATNGVNIPGQKAMRNEIMHMFKDHLTKLKSQLNVRISIVTYHLLLSFCSAISFKAKLA